MHSRLMGSERIIEQLPLSLQRLLTFERFHQADLEAFQDTSLDPSFDSRYFPQNCGAFQLPCFWIRRKYLYVYGGAPDRRSQMSLSDGDGLEQRMLFPVHPTSLGHYRDFLEYACAENAAADGLRIWAAPTASKRTLLAWPDQAPEKALFIKTSLHSPVSGDRRLHARIVGRSIGNSTLATEAQPMMPDGLCFFPEVMGMIPRVQSDSGAIVRLIPTEIKAGEVVVAPLFSLWGGSGDHRPLFLTILERSGMSAAQFVENVLCAQFAKLWSRTSMECGVLLETHGQDMLLGLSPDLVPMGCFYYRDFEGVSVDWGLRRARGLPEPSVMPRKWLWYDTYGSFGSSYRYQQLAWGKVAQSLLHYVHMVLTRLNQALLEWQRDGLIGGTEFESGDLTMMFSRHLARAVEEMSGARFDLEYNIFRHEKDRESFYRFTILLMKARKQMMSRSATWPLVV